MPKRNISQYISYKNKVLDYFYFHRNNTAKTIAEELDVPHHTVQTILREELNKTKKEPGVPTYKIIKWKMEQKQKLIKALKLYNESVTKEDRVNI